LDNPSRYRKSIGYWHMIHPSMYEYKYIYISHRIHVCYIS
jgi:hypothetical protein